jgi:hypothetical protein
MKTKMLLAALCAMALTVQAQTFGTPAETEETWNFTLSGAGTTVLDGSTTAFGLEFSLSKDFEFVLPWELGLRQGVAYTSEGNDIFLDSTLFLDWRVLRYKGFELLLGGYGSYTYGNIDGAVSAGPEAVVKVWLKKDVYAYGRVGYDFSFEDDACRDYDTIRYGAGLGLKF